MPIPVLLMFRFLFNKRSSSSKLTLIAFLGVFIGTFVLVCVMSIMNGFHRDFVFSIVQQNPHMILKAKEQSDTSAQSIQVKEVQPLVRGMIEDYESHLKQESPHSLQAILAVTGEIFIASDRQFAAAEVQAYADSQNYEEISYSGSQARDEGELQQSSDVQLIADPFGKNLKREEEVALTSSSVEEVPVTLSYALAERLNVRVDDTLYLLSPKVDLSFFGPVPRTKSARVQSIDRQLTGFTLLLDFKWAQQLLVEPGEASHVEFYISNPLNVQSELSFAVDHLPPQYEMTSWQDHNRALLNALNIEQTIMLLVLMMIVLIALLNILTGLIMLVRNKLSEIAILKTVGMSQSEVMRTFFGISFLVSCVGLLLGVVVAVIFLQVYQPVPLLLMKIFPQEKDLWIYLSELPIVFDWSQIFIICFFIQVFSLLVALYPAWRASKVHPVSVLRYN